MTMGRETQSPSLLSFLELHPTKIGWVLQAGGLQKLSCVQSLLWIAIFPTGQKNLPDLCQEMRMKKSCVSILKYIKLMVEPCCIFTFSSKSASVYLIITFPVTTTCSVTSSSCLPSGLGVCSVGRGMLSWYALPWVSMNPAPVTVS